MNQRSNSRTALFAALSLMALSVPAFCKGGGADGTKRAERQAEAEIFGLLKTEIGAYRELMKSCNEVAERNCTWAEAAYRTDVFRPTKSMLDILSERIDCDLNQRLTLIMSPGDEEEGKCPYCERTGLKYTRSTPDSNLGFRIDGNELSICLCELDGQRVLSKFKINYCPMCRRNLEEIR